MYRPSIKLTFRRSGNAYAQYAIRVVLILLHAIEVREDPIIYRRVGLIWSVVEIALASAGRREDAAAGKPLLRAVLGACRGFSEGGVVASIGAHRAPVSASLLMMSSALAKGLASLLRLEEIDTRRDVGPTQLALTLLVCSTYPFTRTPLRDVVRLFVVGLVWNVVGLVAGARKTDGAVAFAYGIVFEIALLYASLSGLSRTA